MAGRKPKLTPEVQQALCAAIQNGHYAEIACQWAGIVPQTYYRWLDEGERARSGPKREFRDAIKKAESAHQVTMLKKIQEKGTATDGDWKALAWIMERRYPKQWGRRKLEITGADDTPLPVTNVQPIVNVIIEGGVPVHPPIVDEPDEPDDHE